MTTDSTSNRLAEKAWRIAQRAHLGQTDKAGVPYINHPERVAERFEDPWHQATALLHDVLEDTDVTAADLRDEGIPETVIMAVEALTQRPGEDRLGYYRRINAAGPMALAVKHADIDDNADWSRLRLLDPATRERLTAKYAKARKYLAPVER